MSEESQFEIYTLQDFLESLDILGFARCSQPEAREKKDVCYRFINPNFKPFQDVPEDLYKLKVSIKNVGTKNTKRMLGTHNFQLLQKLLRKKNHPELKITPLQLSRMKLQFALEKQLDILCSKASVIEYDIQSPDYAKNNEIAGYYGDVGIETLKEGFANFFPMYQKTLEETKTHDEVVAMDVEQEVAVECEQVKALDDDQPTKPKRPKITKQMRDVNKETEMALLNLHLESTQEVEP